MITYDPTNGTHTDHDQQAKKDLAQAYQLMMQSAAWKHFEKILNRIEESATTDEDTMPIDLINLAKIGECRGRREAIRKVKAGINYILEGLK